MRGTNRGLFSKLNSSCKKETKNNPWWAVRNPPPWRGANTLSSVTPMTQHWWMHFPLCPWGWKQGVAPPKALRISPTWRGNLSFVMVALAMAITIAIAITISIAVADSILVAFAIAIAIAHRRCHCCRPLLLHSPSTIAAAISVTLLSAIAVTVTLAVGHCRLRHHRPLQLPSLLSITIAMPSAVSESCCLGAARIVCDQLKQRMLTLFYCVWTVGSALIEAGWLTRCRAAMANTSIGRRAASSEQLVWEVAGSRGAAGGQKGGDVDWSWEVFFCLVVGVSAIDRWHLWWCVGCGRRHCRWDSDWTDARRK